MKSIQWKLVVIYILLLLFSLELFGVYMLSSIENYFLNDLKQNVHGQVGTLAAMAARYYVNPSEHEGLPLLIQQYGPVVTGEVYMLNDKGKVLAANAGNADMVGRRMVPSEVITALAGRPAESIRFMAGSNERSYYYAEPVLDGIRPVGVVYVRTSLRLVDSTLRRMRSILVTGALITLVVSALLSLNIATTITSPLQAITYQAEALKRGDFNQKLKIDSEDEIGRLAYTFNTLAEQLQFSWDEVNQEKEKVEGILTNLSDGILVFDHSGKILHINATACNWFGVNQEMILKSGSITDLPQLNQKSGLINLTNNIGTVLRQRRMPFLQSGKKQGTILVLSDVTEQHRLDTMRQEFVANVSHELRTPLTTIKSYIEALLENPDESPTVKTRFLEVVNNETDRMVRMVEDLLTLSRTEADNPKEYRLLAVEEILQEIVNRVQVQVQNKGLTLEMHLPKHLPLVRGDRDQLYRVFLNIISNSVKYTPSGGKVIVSADSRNNYVEFSIADTGIGIPSNSLGRIFERFYRVDKARTRKDGGTGLGLSIVRQIVEAHSGTISVSSIEGSGTEVIVTVPIGAKKIVSVSGNERVVQDGED